MQEILQAGRRRRDLVLPGLRPVITGWIDAMMCISIMMIIIVIVIIIIVVINYIFIITIIVIGIDIDIGIFYVYRRYLRIVQGVNMFTKKHSRWGPC